MLAAGASLLRTTSGGGGPGGAMSRRCRAAAAAAVAALLGLSACNTTYPRVRPQQGDPQAVMQAVDSGLDFYTAGDYVLAARRFEEAARGARVCGDLTMERKATTAECTSWLRSRRLEDLDACALRLEALQRQERRSDPGLNTLLAMGAIAGDRPLPPFRVPAAVHPIMRASARAQE